MTQPDSQVESPRDALHEAMAEAWREACNDYAGDDNDCMDALAAQAALDALLAHPALIEGLVAMGVLEQAGRCEHPGGGPLGICAWCGARQGTLYRRAPSSR